ncbi:MAG TPA: MMPL family transporter, partial [Alphaproteobacteria bacterium]|nr:MMPL family transporter [Alphaproteobacteria bacterium]
SGTPQALSWQGLLSEEEGINQRLIWLLPKLDFGELQPAKPALKAIDEELALLRPMLHDGTTVGVTGNPALRADELESVVVGIGMSLALSLALVAVLLLIGLRSFAGSAFTIICLIVSIVLTTGFAAIAVGELNLISIAFAVLLIGLGLDFAIHFLLHVREAERSGKKRHHALTGTAKVVGPALALSAPTTAIAFFSFMPTDFVGMAQLGLIGGVGVLIAFVVSMTLLPALLALVRSRPAARVRSPVDPPITGRPRRIGSLLPLLILVLGVAAAAALPFVRFEADPMALRAPESRSVTAFQWLYEEERTVPYRASLLVQSEEEAKAAAAQFQELAVVKAANTVSDLVPENQDAKLDLLDISAPSFLYAIEGPGLDLPTAAPELTPAAALAKRLQDARDGTGAAALAAALNSFRAETELNPEFAEHVQKDVFRYFPQLIELLTSQLDAGFVTVESLPEAMRERFVADDGTRRVEIVPAADMRNLDAREAFVEAVKAVEPEVTGGAVQVVEAGETVASAMLQATLTALVLVVVLIGTLLRDPVRAGLVVIPLALAAFLTCAAGVLFGVPFNYANVIVLPLLIGAGVDSSIHLLLRSGKLSESGRLFSTSTPRAVTFSALTTVAAFGSLALSPHRGTASMGELLAIAIGFMLLTTLTVLPWLITLRRPRSG